MRKILLTGCTKGLGRAMLDRFTEAGHQVAGCGRTSDQIESLQQQYGSPHQFQQLDVTDAAAVQSWAEELLGDGFVPDLLINNAGIINRNARLWEIEPEEFEQICRVNLCGVFNIIHAFVPHMVERQEGIIVNFSSGWGRSVSAQVAPYCGTKWGIEGMTLALAEELPDGMAAIPLNPGIINTEMLQSCFGSSASSFPEAQEWSRQAAERILSFGPRDNGQSLTA